MSVQTVAQLLAVISADTSALDSRLAKVEEGLKKSEQQFNSLATVANKSMATVAASTTKATDALKLQRAESDNLAKFEYQLGVKSAAEYKTYLASRIGQTSAATSEYTRLANQYALAVRKINSDLNAENKRLLDKDIADHKIANAEKLRSDKLLKDSAVLYEKEREAQEKAVQSQILQTAKEAEVAANRQKESAASLARFEYEQGYLSAENYKMFLEQRMVSYEGYTQEYKSAALQIVRIDRKIEAERVQDANEAQRQMLAYQKEVVAQRVALEKEANAQMAAANKAYAASVAAQATQTAAASVASSSSASRTRSNVANGIGTAAAGISGVELGSAIMAANFDHAQIGIANNTLMTDADIKQMRETTLRLAKDTGQPLDDLAKGYMHITNFGANAKDAIKELTVANKEAVATMSSTSDVSNALATSLHIFGANADQAAGYMDVLHHSAAAGNLTVQDFVASSGKALAISAEMKDKFYDAATAMSLLSRAGFDAAQAATQIQNLVAHIADPADKATRNIKALQTAFHEMNPKSTIDLMYDFSQPGIQAKGLLGIMKDLYAVTHGNASEIAAILPTLRGGVGGTALTQLFGKDGGKEVNDTLLANKQLQLANTGAETQAVYQRMMNDSAQKVKAFVTVLQTDFIPIGEKAIDVFIRFEPALKSFTNGILSIMNAFQKLPVPIQEVVTAIGALFILEKFTGILAALRIPLVFTMGLKSVISLTKALATEEGIATIAGAAQAAGIQGLGASFAAFAAATGPIALVVAALVGLGIELHYLIESYNSMTAAQAQAASGAVDFANKQASVASQGERGQLEVNSGQIAESLSGRKVALANLQEQRAQLGKGEGSALNAKRIVDLDVQIAKVKSDVLADQVNYKKEMDRLHTLYKNQSGYGPSSSYETSADYAPTHSKIDNYSGAISKVAKMKGIDPKIIETIINNETGGNPNATNHNNNGTVDYGIMQVNSATKDPSTYNWRDPMTNIMAGVTEFQGKLARAHGNLQEGFRRYNGGGPAAEAYGRKAIAYYNSLGGEAPVASGDTSSSTRAVTPGDLASSVANEKERTAQLKAAAKAAKELETLYKSHYASLLKIAAVGEAAVNKNAPSTKYQTGVDAETSQGGVLFGISGSERANLMSAAKRADAATDLRKHMEEEQKILEVHQKELEKIADKRKAVMLELEYAPKLDAPGNEALKKAVAQSGGVQEWMKLGNEDLDQGPRRTSGRLNANGNSTAQNAYISIEGISLAADYAKQIRDIALAQKDETKALEDSNTKSVNYSARAEAIDKFNSSHLRLIEGINNELEGKEKINRLAELEVQRASAGDIGNNKNIFSHANSIEAETAANNAKEQESMLSIKQLTMTIGDFAVAQWRASAAGQDMIKTLGASSDKVIAYEQSLRNATGQENNTKGVLQQQGLMDGITKQTLELNASNPFDAWLKSFYVLQTTLNANGQSVMGYVLPNGMNVDSMKKIYDMQMRLAEQQKAQEMKKQAIEGLSSAISTGVMSAFSPNPQVKGTLQTQLLQQQQEQMQYKIAEAQFKSQHPGDPNDPYIDRLKLIQREIDKTKQKLGDMGNNLGSTFKRLFGGIYDSFVQSLQKMAQSYMQSALLGYLTKQIGSGQGPVSGQGSGGFLGGLAGLIGTGMSIFSAAGGGGGKSSGNNSNNGAFGDISGMSTGDQTGLGLLGTIVPMFAKGGHFDGTTPIMVGDGGEPEIIVPDAPGTVIPMSKVQSTSGGRAVMGNQTIVHQKLTQNISTPDAQSFRSSMATQKQGVRRLMRQM